ATAGGSSISLSDGTIAASGSCTFSVNVTATSAGTKNNTPGTLTSIEAGDISPSSATLTVNKADQTISFAALPDVTYGATNFNLSASATSTLTVSFGSTTTAVCTVSGTTVAILKAGPCSITGSQGGNSNYNAAPSVIQVHGEQGAADRD